jgi:hypothetical protein
VKADDVPPPAELTAHVRTATDGAIRWLDRALNADPGDVDTWDQASFYARMMLMRGLERGELIGWALDRERAETRDPDRATMTRSGVAYWGEARDGLDVALRTLRRLADSSPTVARADVVQAREGIAQARDWLEDLAQGLARTEGRSVDVVELPPPRSHDLDLDLEAG